MIRWTASSCPLIKGFSRLPNGMYLIEGPLLAGEQRSKNSFLLCIFLSILSNYPLSASLGGCKYDFFLVKTSLTFCTGNLLMIATQRGIIITMFCIPFAQLMMADQSSQFIF